jgi:hypothetical protein
MARGVEREIIPAYDAAQWTDAATVPVAAAPQRLLARLERLSPELAASYQQVHRDLNADRVTFIGPAGEIREVLRAAIHHLAPDADVQQQPWFERGSEPPYQSERIRYIVQQRSSPDAPSEAADLVDERVGRLGRTLYGRTSSAFHTTVQREELMRIVGYVDAILNEILPL